MKIPRVSHSGVIRLGDAEMPVHVLPGGMALVEVTSIESMIGLPPSVLGDFFTTLPGGGGRVQFERAADVCTMCAKGAPASHRLKKQRAPRCGACADQARRMGLAVTQNHGPMVTVWGLPAESVPDLLSAFMVANRGTAAAQKAREILLMLMKRGLRAAGQDPDAAEAIMTVATMPRSER